MRRNGRPRVAVVDDDPHIRKLLQAFLTGCGYEVRLHSGGQSVIDSFAHELPDAVLLDLQMPGLSGFDVVRELQADTLPLIVFVTAFANNRHTSRVPLPRMTGIAVIIIEGAWRP